MKFEDFLNQYVEVEWLDAIFIQELKDDEELTPKKTITNGKLIRITPEYIVLEHEMNEVQRTRAVTVLPKGMILQVRRV